MSRPAKYPDTIQLNVLEEELGIAIDQEFLNGQRAALQRIQSERFCMDRGPSAQFKTGTNYQSKSCRNLPSTSAATKATVDEQIILGLNASQAEIQEQQRIFDQLRFDRPQRCTGETPKCFVDANDSRKPNKTNTSAHPPASDGKSLDNHIGRFPKGPRVRIKGASHVYNEISRGNAIVVQCPNCETFLQVGKDTVNVFCSVCQEISPICLMVSSQSVSPHIDYEIASNVQEQEFDVACARLKAKLSAASISHESK